jgi:hypothetical protein
MLCGRSAVTARQPAATSRRRSGTDGRDLVAAFTGTTRFFDFQKLLAVPPESVADRLQRLGANGILTATPEWPSVG